MEITIQKESRIVINALCVVTLHLFLAANANAQQLPGTINYQGRLTELDGTPVDTGLGLPLVMDFGLYDVDVGGVPLWEEQQDVEVDDGVFSVVLGSVIPIDLDFDLPYWLEIVVDGDLILDRVELVPVPYSHHAISAVYASDAGTLDGYTVADLDQSGDLADHAADPDAHVGQVPLNGDVISSLENEYLAGPNPGSTPDIGDYTDSITISTSGSVREVRLALDLSHPELTDISIYLQSPDGTQVTLHDQQPGANIAGVYGEDLAPADGSMNDFAGGVATGSWTLTVRDYEADGQSGAVNSWHLDLDVLSDETVTLDGTLAVDGDVQIGGVSVALADDSRFLTESELQELTEGDVTLLHEHPNDALWDAIDGVDDSNVANRAAANSIAALIRAHKGTEEISRSMGLYGFESIIDAFNHDDAVNLTSLSYSSTQRIYHADEGPSGEYESAKRPYLSLGGEMNQAIPAIVYSAWHLEDNCGDQAVHGDWVTSGTVTEDTEKMTIGSNSAYAYWTGTNYYQTDRTVIFRAYASSGDHDNDGCIDITDGTTQINMVVHHSFDSIWSVQFDGSNDSCRLYQDGEFYGEYDLSSLNSAWYVQFRAHKPDPANQNYYVYFLADDDIATPSSTLSIEVSADGGASYESPNNGEPFTFGSPGRSIVFRFEYTRSSDELLLIDGWGLMGL